jgi:hypothetical protein
MRIVLFVNRFKTKAAVELVCFEAAGAHGQFPEMDRCCINDFVDKAPTYS